MGPDLLDLELVVRRLAADAKARVSADAAAIWLLGLDGSELDLHAALGFARGSTARTLAHRPFGRLAEWLTTRRPPALAAVPASPAAGRAWLGEESIRSVLAVPLVAGGIRIGLLAAFRRRRPFTASHLAAMREVAAAGGPSIHAALRFAEEREHVERAEMLLAVTQTLASTTDLPAALDEVSHRTAAALGAERCEIELADTGRPARVGSLNHPVELVVPIGHEYDAIGALRLVRSERGEWAPNIVELATAIAGQIALAAENARLVRQTEAHADELGALHDVTATLTSTLDLPTVLEAVADSARALIGAQRCGVFELDASQQLVPRVSRGVPVDALLTLRPGQGAIGAAALRRAPFFTPDWREHEPPGYATDRLANGELMRDAVRRQGVRAILAVPVVFKDALVGVIAAAWEEPHSYDEREVRLLAGLARQAAVALDRARVHTAAVRRADELGALLRAARTVMAGLDPRATLEQIVHEAGGIAGTPHVNVLVVDPTTRTLRVGALTGRPGPPHFSLALGTVDSRLSAVTSEPTLTVDATHRRAYRARQGGRWVRRVAGGGDGRLRRAQAIIGKAGKAGAEVVGRLQQFSRPHQLGRAQPLSLDDVARDVLGLTRGHWQDGARARGVSIEVEDRLAGATTVGGNAAALREAVTNLVLNAIDAMPKGGPLTLETRIDGDHAVLVVADTGIGMSESVRLNAHEPFFTPKGVKATGLGLSVAYGIVRSHGGELGLDSREGHGTTVTLTLPRAAVPPPTAPPAAPPRTGALRLLLVDDEHEVREALAEMLQSHGHTVLTAAGADEALARFESEPDLDLVLTDLVMPGRTGWDVAAGVKARRPHVAVRLITDSGHTTDVDEARRALVDFVVEKPVTVEALQEALAPVRDRE